MPLVCVCVFLFVCEIPILIPIPIPIPGGIKKKNCAIALRDDMLTSPRIYTNAGSHDLVCTHCTLDVVLHDITLHYITIQLPSQYNNIMTPETVRPPTRTSTITITAYIVSYRIVMYCHHYQQCKKVYVYSVCSYIFLTVLEP